jgi:hypothetical protein
MTNELGQLRVCDLVATKAHSQIEPHLRQVSASLDFYGFPQPEVIYTDNMSDASLLQSCFPSLLKDVVPVEKHSHLPEFKLPDGSQILVYDTTAGIEHAVRTILDSFSGTEEEVTVGFDMEWNVQVGHGTQRREVTALIQVAYKNTVYLLRVRMSATSLN